MWVTDRTVQQHVELCSISLSLHQASASYAFGEISPFLWHQKMFVLFLQRHIWKYVVDNMMKQPRRPLFLSTEQNGKLVFVNLHNWVQKMMRPRCQADFLDAKLVNWDFSDSDVHCATCPDAQTSATFHTGRLSKKFLWKPRWMKPKDIKISWFSLCSFQTYYTCTLSFGLFLVEVGRLCFKHRLFSCFCSSLSRRSDTDFTDSNF